MLFQKNKIYFILFRYNKYFMSIDKFVLEKSLIIIKVNIRLGKNINTKIAENVSDVNPKS